MGAAGVTLGGRATPGRVTAAAPRKPNNTGWLPPGATASFRPHADP